MSRKKMGKIIVKKWDKLTIQDTLGLKGEMNGEVWVQEFIRAIEKQPMKAWCVKSWFESAILAGIVEQHERNRVHNEK